MVQLGHCGSRRDGEGGSEGGREVGLKANLLCLCVRWCQSTHAGDGQKKDLQTAIKIKLTLVIYCLSKMHKERIKSGKKCEITLMLSFLFPEPERPSSLTLQTLTLPYMKMVTVYVPEFGTFAWTFTYGACQTEPCQVKLIFIGFN